MDSHAASSNTENQQNQLKHGVMESKGIGHFFVDCIMFVMHAFLNLFGCHSRKDSSAASVPTAPTARAQSPSTGKPTSAPISNTQTISLDSKEHTVVVLSPVDSSQTTPQSAAAAEKYSDDVLEVRIERDNLPEPAADETKNTLVIKNLPFKFKQADLEKILNTYEAKPKNVRLMRDSAGRFTGIAFIRCPTKEAAGKLIILMNGLEVQGRAIQVEFKKRKAKKRLSASTDAANASSDEDVKSPISSLASSAEHSFSEDIREPVPPAPKEEKMELPLADVPRLDVGTTNAKKETAETRLRKLAVSAQQPRTSSLKKVDLRTSGYFEGETSPKLERRRLSICSAEDAPVYSRFPRSAIQRPIGTSASTVSNNRPIILPIRQPVGPDGRTNGFSLEYKSSRRI
jgi:RNA recognition motif-containing protein